MSYKQKRRKYLAREPRYLDLKFRNWQDAENQRKKRQIFKIEILWIGFIFEKTKYIAE